MGASLTKRNETHEIDTPHGLDGRRPLKGFVYNEVEGKGGGARFVPSSCNLTQDGVHCPRCFWAWLFHNRGRSPQTVPKCSAF